MVGDEILLVWNHKTGTLGTAAVAYIGDHDREMSYHSVIRLVFSDGTTLDVVEEHVFYDATLAKYVAINEQNAKDYVGHSFVKNVDDQVEQVTLERFEILTRYTGVYEVITSGDTVCFTNNILSAPIYYDDILNIFDIDSDTMAYDQEKIMSDIETYGLYTTEDFEGLMTAEEFEKFNLAYMKIAVGKGYLTWDQLLMYIELFRN